VLEYGDAIKLLCMLVELGIESDDLARTTTHPCGAGAARNVQLGEQICVAGPCDNLPNPRVVRRA